MERAQLQARVDELLERVSEADRLRAELERMKVITKCLISRPQATNSSVLLPILNSCPTIIYVSFTE